MPISRVGGRWVASGDLLAAGSQLDPLKYSVCNWAYGCPLQFFKTIIGLDPKDPEA